jgi:hypothetical protein
MILTIASIVLCGCPGLASCAFSIMFFSFTPQSLIDMAQQYGVEYTQNLADTGTGLWTLRIGLGLVALVLIAIPIIIGLITLRRSNRVTE